MSLTSDLNLALLHRLTKPVLWLLCLTPAAWLIYGLFANALGPNPAETLIRSTGDWSLRMLCLALAITPLRQLFNLYALAKIRRLIGLFTFFYVVLHAVCYAWFDMYWQWGDIWHDILQRPFILVGMLTFIVLLLLAITSPKAILKAMGAKNWQRLHHCIHLAAWLALLHFYWMRLGKNNLNDVFIYAAIVVVLQGWRVYKRMAPTQRKTH
ncbi:MAG: sulfite oxidase heme-binding subunit YedZ [Paenalcaligenes sp.]